MKISCVKNKKDPIHFIGIGGIGMSAIAEVLIKCGYQVQGSDMSENANVQRLKSYGIKIFKGHEAGNVKDAKVLVRSTAIKDNNVEVREAEDIGIPVIHRSDMLAEIIKNKVGIAITGTHGKTSTTAMVTELLETAKKDPTVINGGIINNYKNNAKVGSGDLMVIESDESDGTFAKYDAKIRIVTNLEPEHLDYYGNFENLKKCFDEYLANSPKDGLVVLCAEDKVLMSMYGKYKSKSNFVTYGFTKSADVYAENMKQKRDGVYFDVVFNLSKKRIIKDVRLASYGKHNILNFLAAIAVADFLKIPDALIKQGVGNYNGVQRRFTRVGVVDDILIIDDYAHHPTEIKVTVDTAKSIVKKGEKIIAVLQPHRYTRVADLFEEFSKCLKDVDVAILANIYAAGQVPIPGVNQDSLYEKMKCHKTKNLIKLIDENELLYIINKIAKKGDVILFMGAGDITKWSRNIYDKLKVLREYEV